MTNLVKEIYNIENKTMENNKNHEHTLFINEDGNLIYLNDELINRKGIYRKFSLSDETIKSLMENILKEKTNLLRAVEVEPEFSNHFSFLDSLQGYESAIEDLQNQKIFMLIELKTICNVSKVNVLSLEKEFN